jgi:diketogulonate reductase-like aldo/keto reductase
MEVAAMYGSIDDAVALANGAMMPRFGLGTYKSAEGGDVEGAVAAALRLGYRLIDTASLYGNEEGIGRALAASGMPRAGVFLTSKVWNDEQGYDATLAAGERSLARLGTDYLDCYLVHWPRPETPETWRAMERLLAEGTVRSIGVCNHLQHHLETLLETATVLPMIDQFEFHPWLQQPSLVRYCAEHDIVVQAWAPIMRGRTGEVPALVEAAATHGKTTAQAALRWALQRDVCVIPKSVHESRIAENADIFDFELTADEMRTIDAADRDGRLGKHPDHAW